MTVSKPKNKSPSESPVSGEIEPRITVLCSEPDKVRVKHYAIAVGVKSLGGFARIAMAEYVRNHFPSDPPLFEENTNVKSINNPGPSASAEEGSERAAHSA